MEPIKLTPENKKAWLEELREEEKVAKKNYDDLKTRRVHLKERIKVLGRMVENSEKQAAMKHYEDTHVLLIKEGKRELGKMTWELSEKKKEEGVISSRLELIENLTWYIENGEFLKKE